MTKPEIPQFIADFIEEHKDSDPIYEICIAAHSTMEEYPTGEVVDDEDVTDEEIAEAERKISLAHWFCYYSKTFYKACLCGYTVKEDDELSTLEGLRLFRKIFWRDRDEHTSDAP